MSSFKTFVAALALGAGLASASAHGAAMRTEDQWDARHISQLPSEVRIMAEARIRACGGTPAASHSFTRYLTRGRVQLIGLHYEHARCGGQPVFCNASGCLHQIYVSTGGRFRLLQSLYVPELDLTEVRFTKP
ncbi:MAG: hypothetical protein AB1490_00560 [Pseudomonadota bacterium]